MERIYHCCKGNNILPPITRAPKMTRIQKLAKTTHETLQLTTDKAAETKTSLHAWPNNEPSSLLEKQKNAQRTNVSNSMLLLS
ncbi:hypothetical protein IscW_ISCW000622 [Ixodes scapularis]|uniref:Uncharacterized protein n=1 Tax=Ixodes scapularis TaxID=6945 RepID=B7P1C9_IXOSC|nr:hypothetical protein IscW_ISCW000622 [Ixodes scapularis]|eukprot:XP_002433337.1 hypothetical protein IscW_ISCW000622 [Ixodes scapularis]